MTGYDVLVTVYDGLCLVMMTGYDGLWLVMMTGYDGLLRVVMGSVTGWSFAIICFLKDVTGVTGVMAFPLYA
jgi:hypothetical protein